MTRVQKTATATRTATSIEDIHWQHYHSNWWSQGRYKIVHIGGQSPVNQQNRNVLASNCQRPSPKQLVYCSELALNGKETPGVKFINNIVSVEPESPLQYMIKTNQ